MARFDPEGGRSSANDGDEGARSESRKHMGARHVTA